MRYRSAQPYPGEGLPSLSRIHFNPVVSARLSAVIRGGGGGGVMGHSPKASSD